MLATILTAFKDAITSGMSGTSRPANIKPGGMWIDTTNESTANGSRWSFKIYTGSIDIEVFRLSVSTSGQYGGTVFGDSEFDVEHIAADAAQAYVEFIKQRIISNGQILNGDTVMEIDWTGTNNLGTNPTLAYLRFTATDDQTTSSYGGTLSFASTPDATNAITEHFRLISGYFETVKPHKMNSQRHVSQNVATTGTPITALSSSVRVVEFTGSTATDIQGMDAATGPSQVVTIHNRSTAVVTVRHLNSSATAANRFQLPKGRDLAIPAQGTAVFYYCVADSRWKAKEIPAMVTKLVRTLDTVKGVTSTWSAPSTTTEISIVTYPRCNAFQVGNSGVTGAQISGSLMIGPSGEPYAWGAGVTGNLGDGTLIPKSSPVAVLGSLRFLPTNGEDSAAQAGAESSIELDLAGNAYCWGQNGNGQLGNGGVAVASSPVAVLGNLRLSSVYQNPRNGTGGTTFFGMTPNGSMFAWGASGVNQGTGYGDGNPRSSPVAVVGGLKFSRFYSTGLQHVALQTDGTAYTWGSFTIGASGGGLGVGDTLGRSSPVAVLGGLKFQKISFAGLGTNAGTCFFGLTTGGAAYVWGQPSLSFGSGVAAPQSSPVAVVGGLTFTDIFATYVDTGGPRFWAITADGTPYAWGVNTNASGGYLGIGNAGTNASSPVAVLGGLKFKKIIPFNGGAFGITADGTAYSWGINTSGNLGLGDVNPRSSPVAVLGGLKFDDISVNTSLGVIGLTTDGNIYTWGENAIGQLGLGDLVARSSPVAVLGGMTADTRSSRGTRVTIPVTAGSNYTVNLGHGNCTFGGQLIGTDIEHITIEYDK